MVTKSAWSVLLLVTATACQGAGKSEPAANQTAAKPPGDNGVAPLTAGRFDAARAAADRALTVQGDQSTARVVRAIAGYQAAGVDFFARMDQLEEGFERGEPGADQKLRQALLALDAQLAEIDGHLAVAERDPHFALELCLACWPYDWNQSGELDERDRRMLEIEFDRTGAELDEGDQRRRPTYRFDSGDILWARAMVSFQRAALRFAAAYRWSDLVRAARADAPVIRVGLAYPDDVRTARDLILAGLDHADRCREAYLAETDDDREWVPSPRQKDYPVPLEVDAALYDTWKGVIADLRDLVAGTTAVSLDELAAVASEGRLSPRGLGYLDLGRALSEPRDVAIEVAALEQIDGVDEIDRALAERLFGYLLKDEMRATPLIARLARVRDSLERGEDTLERKMRYLFWLN